MHVIMHIILWEFTVRNELIKEFVLAYGSDGEWAKLFRNATGYLGTELLRSSSDHNTFLTFDRWEDAGCFERFQDRFGAEYKKLDAQLEELTLTEKKLGTFSKF
jgi:heme-degrading monooxygenase HmoA